MFTNRYTLWHLRALVAALGALLVTVSCDTSSNDGANGPTPSPYPVHLTGRVLDKDGRGIPNAVATLASRGIWAVTNTDGEYQLIDSSLDTAVHKALVVDSVLVERDGQLIATLNVEQYVGSLPDLFIVQRDIYGTIAPSVRQFTRIEAVISGGAIPAERPAVVELWHNTATNGFSGFVYFVYTPQVANYTVYINLFGADSSMIGRSDTVRFSSLAGDVQVPQVDPVSALPTLSIVTDTIASLGDTIRMVARASDPFGGAIACYSWNLGGGNWSACADSDTVLIAAMTARSVACSARVVDNDGNRAVALARIRIGVFAPVADAGPDAGGLAGEMMHLLGMGQDTVGSIVKYEWDIGGTGTFVESATGDANVMVPGSSSEKITCVLRVTDDDGNQDTDTVYVGATSGFMSFMVGYNDSDAATDTNPGWLRWLGSDPWNIPGDREGCWAQLVCVGSASTPVADCSDSVVYAYRLSSSEEASFASGDSAVSPFWSSWVGRDSIRLAPPANAARWNSVIVDTLDATLGVKVAHGARGLYVMVNVVDDSWMGSDDSDFSIQDIVKVWLDGNTPERIEACTDCLIGMYSSLLTYQSVEVSVQARETWRTPRAEQYAYDDNQWAWTRTLLPTSGSTALETTYKVVSLGANCRVVEIFVPWSLLR